MMKNAFYFTIKVLFAPETFGSVEKRLDQKDKINFKYLKSQPGKQTIVIPHIDHYLNEIQSFNKTLYEKHFS